VVHHAPVVGLEIHRCHVAVFGAPKAFNYMADAMATFQTRGSNRYECRAVFVHEEASRDLYLIYADGKHHGDTPIKMKHYSFNLNPGNDVDFVRELPDLLDRLKEDNRSLGAQADTASAA